MVDPTAFVKTRQGAHPDFFAAEAAGLRWLADGGARVADVLEVDRTHIALARLDTVRPSVAAAEEFGVMLARLHASGADGFGSAPPTAPATLFIGNREMSRVVHASWGEFYAVERVLPYLRVAVDAGTVDVSEASIVEKACGAVVSSAPDPVGGPARLHGDLWNGNVVFTESGVVLIDPAAHGGHPETDLAMLSLFGCPFLPDALAAYDDVSPLVPGWEARVPLHQLHPLAVHAAGHGRGYGVELVAAARATLRLLN